jgi:hypothetical protein
MLLILRLPGTEEARNAADTAATLKLMFKCGNKAEPGDFYWAV